MIISFAWMTKALIEGHKTCTRRSWKHSYLAQWQRAWERGKLVHEAWDRLPTAGGRQCGWITLSCRPYLERLSEFPYCDLEAEGGLWASVPEFIDSMAATPQGRHCWVAVIRFVYSLARVHAERKADIIMQKRRRTAASPATNRAKNAASEPSREQNGLGSTPTLQDEPTFHDGAVLTGHPPTATGQPALIARTQDEIDRWRKNEHTRRAH